MADIISGVFSFSLFFFSFSSGLDQLAQIAVDLGTDIRDSYRPLADKLIRLLLNAICGLLLMFVVSD